MIRTDLLSVYMVHKWVHAHAPDCAPEWPSELVADIPQPARDFAHDFQAAYGYFDAFYVAQTLIARTAIQIWKLQNVAILGGGRPHPFSPAPEDVAYFTDGHPEVVAEAERAGYNVLQFDVRDGDFSALRGVENVIATGLFHFVPDTALRNLMAQFAQVGVQRVVANNLRSDADPRLFALAEDRLGVPFYGRSIADMERVVSPDWCLTAAYSLGEFARQFQGEIGAHVAAQPNSTNVFLLERA
ncbi:MAG: hypothetical protein ACLFTK_12360 [Anaerolineales bacterium]